MKHLNEDHSSLLFDLLGERIISLRPTYDKSACLGFLSRDKYNFFMPMAQVNPSAAEMA